MPYTLMMALLWFLLALLIGLVIGWLMRSVVTQRQLSRARSAQPPTDVDRLRARIAELEAAAAERSTAERSTVAAEEQADTATTVDPVADPADGANDETRVMPLLGVASDVSDDATTELDAADSSRAGADHEADREADTGADATAMIGATTMIGGDSETLIGEDDSQRIEGPNDNAENTGNIGNAENTGNTGNTGHAENAENPESAGHAENAENPESAENAPAASADGPTAPTLLGFAALADGPAADAELDLAEAAAVVGSRVKLNDLTVIEGIGPKIADLCIGIGIDSWRELAVTEVSLLRTMLHDAGPRFRTHDPATWPEQAGLLAAGRWKEFRDLTDRLVGGREVD